MVVKIILLNHLHTYQKHLMVEDHKVDLTTIRMFLQMVVHTFMQVIQFMKQILEHKILNQLVQKIMI